MALVQMKWQASLLNQKRKNGPPLGLKNLGNSCYLNSVLQCLTYTPPLANFCLNSLHSSLCDSASEPDRKRDCPFCILEKRIARSLRTDLTLDTPAKIVNCLWIYAEHFKFGRQEDAHEFLRYVIDACHNTCLRLQKLRQQQSSKSTSNGGGETLKSETIVKEIFGGALRSQVKCLSCGTESNKVDEIMDICLEITQSSSLKEALTRFFQAEILDGNNKYKCDRCNKLVAAKKQMSILQAPNVLVVQLKRFEGIFGGKIDRVIAYEDILVLSSFMCKASQDSHPEYSLFATIVHSGFSPESGHYYAYIKDAMGRWYCCNDSYVKLSTLQEVLSEKAYILFFTRTSPKPVSADRVVSKGIDSLDINNGSTTFKSPKSVIPAQAMDRISSNSPPLTQCIPVAGRAAHVSSIQQNKLNGLPNSIAKRAPVSGNQKSDTEKKESVGNNGNGILSVCKQMNGNNIVSLDNSSANCRIGRRSNVESSHISVSNCNGHIHDSGARSAQRVSSDNKSYKDTEAAERMFDNGTVCNGETNGHVYISGSKRKLEERDSCILLAKDIQSRTRVEEFKKILLKEAASVLQSCGWTEKVYKYMRSRKKVCMNAHASDKNEPKKKLIADARSTFIPEVPGSLKEDLIERIRSFSQDK